jgi:four helix bundle protein
MKRHNFKKLQIWQEAIELITLNYGFTASLPDYEKFGLVSQMNRCSVSIASNISEGTSKRTNKHFIKYLEDSLGSAFEWETQLIICKNLNFISEEKFSDLEIRIKKLQQKISNFIDRIESGSLGS